MAKLSLSLAFTLKTFFNFFEIVAFVFLKQVSKKNDFFEFFGNLKEFCKKFKLLFYQSAYAFVGKNFKQKAVF